MTSTVLSPTSPFRIFAMSVVLTSLALVWVLVMMGPGPAAVVAILIVIEITFSFDNAIINARVLATMNRFWQQMFMTLGILIAVFGMRTIFPVVVVMLTANLSWNQVIDLAFNKPEVYARELEQAKPSIAAFGGMFLLMLALGFFFDKSRTNFWLKFVERPLQRIGRWWLGAAACLILLVALLVLPLPVDKLTVGLAGFLGIATYQLVHGLTVILGGSSKALKNSKGQVVLKSGLAGLAAFLYLEVLDASFSFDGVIGAFAVTQAVVLIGIGLGVGALWVRSLTLFMVRRRVLNSYRYLEHGAHYTIAVLAVALLLGLFYKFPEVAVGLIGICIISASVISSISMHDKT